MAFSPEHYITDAGDPVQWAQLRSQSMQQIGKGLADMRREQEQARQFDLTSEENQRQYDLTLGHNRAQLEFDRAKHAADLRQKMIARDIEGIKLIREAHRQSKGVKDFNTNADKIARSHRIAMTPMGSIPPDMARGIAAETADIPDPSAPPGMAPAPMQGAAPATEQGAAIPPGTEDATVAGDEHFGAPGTVPPTVTTAAATVAVVAMGAQDQPPEKVPLDPDDAATAEEAEKAEKENPVVAPPQEVPSDNPHEEALRRLRAHTPVASVEKESRALTDGQVAADMEQRARIIKSAGLSPVSEAVALNMARGALSLPPVPVPPASVQDPNLPPEAQGSGEWEVLIPPEIEALAKAPPKLQPDVVRDALQSGGWDYWNMDTGEYLGSDDWEAIQESRMEYDRQAYAGLSSMGNNPKEVAQIEVAVEAAIRSGSEKPFDILEAMIRMKGQQAAAGYRDAANDRANRAEQRAILDQVETQTTKLVTEQRANAKLEEMHTNLEVAERSLEALRGESGDRTSENALKQRGVIANRLKTLMGARATDKDARLALDTTFRKKVEEWISYVAGDGSLPDEYMGQLAGVFEELQDDELEKAYKTAERLYRVITRNLTVNQLPNVADYQARRALERQFPELPENVIKEIAEKVQGEPREPAPLVEDWSMSEGSSSSRSSSSKGGGGRKTRKVYSDDELDELIDGAP